MATATATISVKALKDAISAERDIVDQFSGVAVSKHRHRSLELAIVNATDLDLVYDGEYHDPATAFYGPQPLIIRPGQVVMIFAATR